jgi:outer membrane protein assembly factor BamB
MMPVDMLLTRSAAVVSGAILLSVSGGGPARADWPQWGGPTRDFQIATELQPRWPEAGPKVAWQRALDEGYSGVAVRGNVLYTMGRSGDAERIFAISARTGETIWTYEYPAPLPSGLLTNHGVGPRSTPLLTSTRVFTVGIGGTLLCLDRARGTLHWRKDLVTGLGGSFDKRGYSSSPLEFGEWIILPVGGDGQALVAFRQADGAIAWKSGDFGSAPSSPMLIDLAGKTHLVALLNGVVAGFDPGSGRLLWKHPHGGRGERNITTPVWGKDGILFLSSAYGGGSRALRLEPEGGATRVKELWAHEQVRVMFTNALRIGDHVYASSGDFGPVPLVGLDVKTGAVVWRDRTFGRLNMIKGGSRVLVLDDKGTLGLVSLSPEGLTVHARVQLRDEIAWTAPSVSDGRAYVRTKRELIALDLP